MSKLAAVLISVGTACVAVIVTHWLQFAPPSDATPPLTFFAAQDRIGIALCARTAEFFGSGG
jgi:hypothetical protein